MPIYSEQTLSERALRKLSVIADGQSASASDVELVTDKIEGLLSGLAVRRVYPAYAVEELPSEAFDAVASLLAYATADEFGVTGESLARLMSNAQVAERHLRILNTANPPIDVLPATYF